MSAKAWAIALLGLPLSVGLVGLAALVAPGPLAARTLPLLLLFFPTWVGVMSAGFLFRSGRQAWLVLGAATAVAFALIVAVKATAWGRLPA